MAYYGYNLNVKKMENVMTKLLLLAFMGAALMSMMTSAKAEEKAEGKRTVVIAVTGMTWGSCAKRVKKALTALQGVESVEIQIKEKLATVVVTKDGPKDEELIGALKKARYGGTIRKSES